MKELLLVGGGGHCRSVIDVIEQEGIFKIVGIVDLPEKLGESISGYKVIATDEDLEKLREKYSYALVTLGMIGDAKRRISLYEKLKGLTFTLPVIKSPRAYVSAKSNVGDGTVIMHDSLVNSGASVGVNCILNTKSLIEHDAIVSDHCHISTAAVINGHANVSQGAFVGSGAVVVNGVTVTGFNKAGGLVK